MTIQSRTRIRTGTAAEWAADNSILSEGELGIETDFLKLKCGNGVDTWGALIYVNQAIISTVGLTGVYSDLTGKPTLGTAAATAIGDYATAAQGATANSALQPGGSGSSLTGITKSQIGLANVDNTSDANKPVSIATQTALDGKQVAGSYATAAQGATADSALQPAGNGGSLTGMTKAQVGLGNVDNTTDAGKPISTAQQTVLDAKQASSAKGQPNGYAGLDGSGLVPVAQLPGIPAAWGAITGTLSAQTDLQTALDAKQVTLVSATNIKTVNNSTLLGSGNLTVSAGDPSYSPGSFTVATETQRFAPWRLKMTTTQRITIEGTGRLSLHN